MRNLANEIIRRNGYGFGTGGANSEEFNTFFESFKRSFKRELKKIDAKDIEFNKGHFYLSGFFTVQGQVIYFSISDVRSYISTNWKGIPEMLVRTAKDYKDFTGGHNRMVAIEPNMSREILRVCNLDVNGFSKPERKIYDGTKKAKDIIAKLEKFGTYECSIPSMKRANHLAWRIGEALGHGSFSITTHKMGRYCLRSRVELDGFSYNYEVSSRTFTVTIEMSDEQLIESLKLPKGNQTRRNTFTGEPCELEPVGVALHDLVKKCESSGQYTMMHKALGMFREKYPEEYMVLLD